ncbi:Flavin-dependent monooxygenase, oxygenase subunit HsaA [BD1-7 clade bacterium]|uniref:Flavin-dependent monooxygenase, oxygenase subunit HsaA n=1 Tax=BD1-7 clade bacterium TaxID=2029982 RepID=A0A5S9N2D2_9GAMM|nr:Flavin-dependent monooxygenase, oxygenase subunit HsaA [BD1-7 clade bacterium]CAA0100100.1 Flavin-dependent monooxygenase, oxygenase subunit HsaA [BD1-7 clade bacterium]CAA0115742.1 Flavin-dependent monooxygenase, oxygenase subunit HsaA [BD1-7 clade bacterium]
MSPENLQLAQTLVERAEAMIPTLKERAPEAAAQGQVHSETVQEMADAGFFRIVQPKRWGGYELDPQVFFDVQMTLAQGDMSVAWILGVIAIHNWQLALFDDRAAQDVWGENDATLISSSYMPVGKVEHVEGGLKLSGRWGFSSGSEHCEWVFLGAIVPPKEGDPAGPPDMRTFLIPRSDYRIEENWDVLGLKATGSNDIVVEGAFVPEYRTHKAGDGFAMQSPGNAVNEAPLFKIPFGQIFVRAVSSGAIGALEGAVNSFIDVAKARVGVNDGKKASGDPDVQFAIAKAQSIVDELKLVLNRNFDRLMEQARGEGEPLSMDERIKMRNDSAAVVQRCIEGVDLMFNSCGGGGIFHSHPVSKYFLDIHAGRAHVANQPGKYARNLGGVQLGEPNGDFFL